MPRSPEVEFVHPVSPGGSVKFVASGVNFSIFTNFLCFFLLKLLKLGEIGGVKFLTWKSGGVKFWTNFMSGCNYIKLLEILSLQILLYRFFPSQSRIYVFWTLVLIFLQHLLRNDKQ